MGFKTFKTTLKQRWGGAIICVSRWAIGGAINVCLVLTCNPAINLLTFFFAGLPIFQ